MGRATKLTNTFATTYPNIARLVNEEAGWIEVGADEFSTSFVRALHAGGMVWEGKPNYPTLDAAFRAMDAGIAEWLEEYRPAATPVPAEKKPVRTAARKKAAELKLVPVESSMLSAIGYDNATKELVAVYNSGAVWRYCDVPKKVYRELLASSSKGSYMRDLIIGTYSDYQV